MRWKFCETNPDASGTPKHPGLASCGMPVAGLTGGGPEPGGNALADSIACGRGPPRPTTISVSRSSGGVRSFTTSPSDASGLFLSPDWTSRGAAGPQGGNRAGPDTPTACPVACPPDVFTRGSPKEPWWPGGREFHGVVTGGNGADALRLRPYVAITSRRVASEPARCRRPGPHGGDQATE